VRNGLRPRNHCGEWIRQGFAVHRVQAGCALVQMHDFAMSCHTPTSPLPSAQLLPAVHRTQACNAALCALVCPSLALSPAMSVSSTPVRTHWHARSHSLLPANSTSPPWSRNGRQSGWCRRQRGQRGRRSWCLCSRSAGGGRMQTEQQANMHVSESRTQCSGSCPPTQLMCCQPGNSQGSANSKQTCGCRLSPAPATHHRSLPSECGRSWRRGRSAPHAAACCWPCCPLHKACLRAAWHDAPYAGARMVRRCAQGQERQHGMCCTEPATAVHHNPAAGAS